MREHINDGLTVIGTALASLGSAGIIPAEYTTVAALSGAVGIVALFEKEYRKRRGSIIVNIRSLIKRETGVDISEDDVGNALDDIAEVVSEVIEDVAEDGKLDKDLKDSAKVLAKDLADKDN